MVELCTHILINLVNLTTMMTLGSVINLDWDNMTMAKVGIEFTPKAIWLWLEKVDLEGTKVKKDDNTKRNKFLEGFTESFDVVITNEKLLKTPGNFKVPITTILLTTPKPVTLIPNEAKPIYTL